MDQTKDYLNGEIAKLDKSILEHNRLLQDPAIDEEMKNLFIQEITSLTEQKALLQQSLTALDGAENQSNNQPADPNDPSANINPNLAILEIRAGTGGDEAGLFAKDLYKMYARYGEKKNWRVMELFSSENEAGGIKTLVVELKGAGVYNKLQHESGVHRVQRVPTTESGGRIHTSTATVAILPQLKKTEIEIKPDDLKWEFFRSGGAGGQNVNKVSTAVRLTHIPSQVIVECSEERAQGKNREKALSMLNSKLYTMMHDQHVKSISDLRTNQVGTGDRSEKIRTYNFPQDRITDHRINKSWHGIAIILNGGLETILDALADNKS